MFVNLLFAGAGALFLAFPSPATAMLYIGVLVIMGLIYSLFLVNLGLSYREVSPDFINTWGDIHTIIAMNFALYPGFMAGGWMRGGTSIVFGLFFLTTLALVTHPCIRNPEPKRKPLAPIEEEKDEQED